MLLSLYLVRGEAVPDVAVLREAEVGGEDVWLSPAEGQGLCLSEDLQSHTQWDLGVRRGPAWLTPLFTDPGISELAGPHTQMW